MVAGPLEGTYDVVSLCLLGHRVPIVWRTRSGIACPPKLQDRHLLPCVSVLHHDLPQIFDTPEAEEAPAPERAVVLHFARTGLWGRFVSGCVSSQHVEVVLGACLVHLTQVLDVGNRVG